MKLREQLASLVREARELHDREDIVLFLLIVAYVVLSYLAAFSIGAQDRVNVLAYSQITGLATVLFFVLFLAYRTLYVVFALRPERPLKALGADLGRYLTCKRMCRAGVMILFANAFFSVFTAMKSLIPRFNGYTWDRTLYEVDLWLHGGTPPWQLLQPLVGDPLLTYVINIVYNLWFFVMFFTLYWQVFSSGNPQLRAQFLYTFFGAWVLNGTVLAVALSSAGPCYFGYLVEGPNPYQALLDYLNYANTRHEIWALETQAMLWNVYQAQGLTIGTGISAMPSIHVATVVALALLGWRTSRALGIAFTLFAATILVGSVHLAWHYAIDGYVSIVTTLALWHASGRLLARDARRPRWAARPALEGSRS